MRWSWLLVLLPTLARAEARPPELPGEREVLGCRKYPATKRFKWGVRGEVGVGELVASLSELSCRPIIVSPAAAQRGGKVTLEVPDLLTADEVYRLFLSSLDAMGLTVEQSGKVLKVVDAGRAREASRPIVAGATPETDQFVTRLLRLSHARPADVVDAVAKLKSKEGEVTAYAPGAALFVTDRATNVRRMEALLGVLDVERAAADHLFVVATHGQGPSELHAALEKILQATRRAEPADPKGASKEAPLADGVTALVPVDAARALVVVGSEAGYRRVAALAARLDPPLAEEAFSQSHVVYLKHTNAEDLAQTLGQMGLGRAGGGPASGKAGAASVVPVQGDVRIAADKTANAIVIFAGAADYHMVRDLILKLDIPRRQVYVEATILDISVDKARSIGLTFHQGAPLDQNGSGALVGNLSTSGANTLSIDAAKLAAGLATGGLLAGVLGSSMNVAGMSLPSFGVILKALETSKDVNVISRPHLLTMDNTKAQLAVGQVVPFPVQSLSSVVSTTNVIANYKREPIELKLDLTPHLSEDAIRLEIDGEISDIPDGGTTTAGGPTTSRRVIKTQVVVQDGETIVLGGLQKESQSESVEKVPFLGDIPVLGRLFQTRSKTRVKQDLLIVLTPYVIRGPEDLRRIYEKKDAERREFIERYTAFRDEAAYEVDVDYARQRGLLQEINLSALAFEREAAAVRAAERSLRMEVKEGRID